MLEYKTQTVYARVTFIAAKLCFVYLYGMQCPCIPSWGNEAKVAPGSSVSEVLSEAPVMVLKRHVLTVSFPRVYQTMLSIIYAKSSPSVPRSLST